MKYLILIVIIPYFLNNFSYSIIVHWVEIWMSDNDKNLNKIHLSKQVTQYIQKLVTEIEELREGNKQLN